MKVAILTVGDELTCGYRLDTNSQAISQRLALLPAEVTLHISVGDDEKAIQDGLRIALGRADAVIVTGGLGPTEDDVTRQAVAAYFGRELVEDARALELIRERFARRNYPMPESNRIQAHVPAGSAVIYNERGTAAGFYLAAEGQHVFVVPGIPYEMEGMLEHFILPRLQELSGRGRHVRRAVLKVYGLPESLINERIRPLMTRGRNPLLGLLPHRGTITVEIVAQGRTAEETAGLVEADLATLRAALGTYIISEDERELPQVVADLLIEHGLTIAVAELGTGGLLAARLTEAEGSERCFRQSMVFSSEEETPGGEDKLNSSPEDAALLMASCVRHAVDADIGVGVGAIHMSTPGERPHGTVHVAVDFQGQEVYRAVRLNGPRLQVREWAADAALGLVRMWLLEVWGRRVGSREQGTGSREQGTGSRE